MFDFGISELAVIAVVALVVIGPERLPKVARTVGTLLGRAQRYVNDVKAEVNREMELEELRKLQAQMQDAARGIQEQVSTAGAEMQSAVHDVEKQLHEGTAPPASSADASPAAAVLPGHAADPANFASAPLTEPPLDAPPAAPAVAAASPATPVAAAAPAPIAPATVAADKPAQTSLFPENTVH